MKTLIVGHRGTGKSVLAQRMGFYFRDQGSEFVDLDLEIENKIGKTIRELFLEHGEPYFREMERQVFLETLQRIKDNSYMVAGAGFDLSIVPEGVRVLWVRRRTDADGRIFLDRPRLEPDLPPLEEFKKRAALREQTYSENADEVYLMPEGVMEHHHRAQAVEKSLLSYSAKNIGGVVTLTADLFRKEFRWELFKSRLQMRGISYFELRDDILTLDQIFRVMSEMASENFVLSLRKPTSLQELQESPVGLQILAKATWVDWALEIGAPDLLWSLVPGTQVIISSHHGEISDLEQYKTQAGHLKWAPLVTTFSDLEKFHQWQQQDPARRSFLPRSFQGRWAWYRLYMKNRQVLNFWREGEGSALDQPSTFEWLMAEAAPVHFAAVLGDPVYHSYTPIEHSDYFAKKNVPVYAITVARDEWNQALPILQKLGLKWAAVTSPHKENAAALCQSVHKALNTIYHDGQRWLGASTDEAGFLELTEGVGMIAQLQSEIFVWGGGGTLGMLQEALPQATYFSARTSLLRESSQDSLLKPKVLVWAAPRTAETQFPPEDWHPSLVLDLNYKEDSMGREYAQRLGVNYASGLVMFTAQAREQRVFWNQCEEKNGRK